MAPLLQVNNLKTYFYGDHSVVKAVNDVSFDVRHGETLAIVGESGSGKSVTAMSILRLIPSPPGEIVGGEIILEGENLLAMDEDRVRDIRGNKIAMIFQEPMTSLNPVLTIGRQIAEPIEIHQNVDRKSIIERCVELLRKVQIPDPQAGATPIPTSFPAACVNAP